MSNITFWQTLKQLPADLVHNRDFQALITNLESAMNPGISSLFSTKSKNVFDNNDSDSSGLEHGYLKLKSINGKELSISKNEVKLKTLNNDGTIHSMVWTRCEPDTLKEETYMKVSTDFITSNKALAQTSRITFFDKTGYETKAKWIISKHIGPYSSPFSILILNFERLEDNFSLQQVNYKMWGQKFVSIASDTQTPIEKTYTAPARYRLGIDLQTPTEVLKKTKKAA